jgi:simple sugar transport system permease protein
MNTAVWFSARTVAWTAVGAVLLGLWLALPPVALRSPWPSVALCALGAVLGCWLIRERRVRVGAAIIVSAVACTVVAVAATRADPAKLDAVVVWSALVAATLTAATPLLFTALGGLISERSGVINIGLEGIMLLGAFFGLLGADLTGSWVGGLAVAAIAGALTALLYGVFAIHLRADQIVGGVAINLLAVGVTGYLLISRYGQQGTPSDLSAVPDVHLGFLEPLSFVGPAFADLNLMVWAGLLLVVVVHVFLFLTPMGLRLCSVGEKPEAAETAGISVFRVRYAAVAASGVLAGLGGAYLSIGFVHSFTENMTAGRGYIALAALVFGAWRPFGALGAVLLFGFASALALRLPEFSDAGATLFQALPYVITLIVVAGLIGRARAPAADGVPYSGR